MTDFEEEELDSLIIQYNYVTDRINQLWKLKEDNMSKIGDKVISVMEETDKTVDEIIDEDLV